MADLHTPDELDARSRAILAANDRGGYTVPNELVYPFQWNWDFAFVAMGMATYDADRAWRELELLFVGQWADGMVPSIVFHQPHPGYYPGPDAWGTTHAPPTTGISQPPVAATAARVVLEAQDDEAGQALSGQAVAGQAVAGQDRARALFPALFASHRWWHETRDPDGTGLVTVVHPWETGRDNSPDWDAPLAGVTPRVGRGGAAQGQDARQRLRAADGRVLQPRDDAGGGGQGPRLGGRAGGAQALAAGLRPRHPVHPAASGPRSAGARRAPRLCRGGGIARAAGSRAARRPSRVCATLTGPTARSTS